MSVARIIAEITRRLSELERRANGQGRVGTVIAVNPGAGLARVRLLDSDPPFDTGWIPWEEMSAGANRTHNPPSTGQQVTIWSETGDLHDAVIRGSLNSDANPRPSGAGDAFVLAQVGNTAIVISDGGATTTITVGGVSMAITSGGVAITGGTVTHNGKDIGDTHTHGGVIPGAASTSAPN